MSNVFRNVIFLFHEGMLTNVEHSAVLLYEETFGQTERSQGTIAVKPPSALFLLWASQEDSGPGTRGWKPVMEPSRIYLGRMTSTTASAEQGHRHAYRRHAIKHIRHCFQHRGQMYHTAREGHVLVDRSGAPAYWVSLRKLLRKVGCWVLLSA